MFQSVIRPSVIGVLCGAALAAATGACMNGSKAVLLQQAEAHKVSSHLHVQFTRADEASNRAVMAETDEASSAAATEARQATEAATHDVDTLRAILNDLGENDEMRLLDAFASRFAQYRALEADILPLAVENTNIKAQRLSFGPAQDDFTAFRQSIEAAGRLAPRDHAAGVDALVARAAASVLEIQVLEARHIAESDEAAMTRMESAMKASEAGARKSLDSLAAQLPRTADQPLASATGALDRFMTANSEIVALSRRNSNVRSLALSLGKKRTVSAECQDLLQSLEDALAAHHFSATR
jgi:hypothetical protein